MRWIQRSLRGNKVYARVDEAGQPLADPKGRVDVVYSLKEGAKIYSAAAKNLEPVPGSEEIIEAAITPAAPAASASAPAAAADLADAIIVYTDGACHGNPGPMGIGVVINDRGERHEYSEFLGNGTNNIAELVAIERALEAIHVEARKTRAVLVHSDSAYSIGLLTKPWKAKANQELVARIRALTKTFAKLSFVKVKGHAGVPDNERCDELANEAVERRS